ncbi:MAG: hypothetical protein MGG11_23285, partial [Trichodesmium sp. MAG_R03]|nr:hypothetical protein [Trichodesmium sp. MAG_R03]
IGSVILDTRTNTIVSFVVVDTAYSEATLEPELTVRFLQPDPLAAAYPDLSPYSYVANNPLIFVDPTGMWIADYDEDGNLIKVTAEDGDDLAGLYDQLGITGEQFAEQFGIEDMDAFEVIAGETTFDITGYVTEGGFSSDPTNMNCFSACLQATGVTDSENQVIGGFKFTESVQALGFEKVGNSEAQTGDLVTWKDKPGSEGTTHHAAIRVIKTSSGEVQYLSRPGPNGRVTLQTSSALAKTYPNFVQTTLKKKQ